MASYRDHMGNDVALVAYPLRIISLVPSLTELLFDLGLHKNVIGVTSYCEVPAEKAKDVHRVGGVKNLDCQKILTLSPDLIIGSKEENSAEDINLLQKKFPAWICDVQNLEDVISLIKIVGRMTDREKQAENLINEVNLGFGNLPVYIPMKVAYLIWKEPWMVAASGTFINSMLTRCGFENAFAEFQRYPVVDLNDLEACEVILLSSEPYPFHQQDVEAMQQWFPQKKVALVDGKKFSWYGSHIRHSPGYFTQLRLELD